MIIGVTGTFCAGKDTAADYLVRNKGFSHYSLSDYLRSELKTQGIEVELDNLVALGNKLRQEHGPGVLGQKALETFKRGVNYVVSSIRHPEEAKDLKKNGNFYLISIDAPAEVRFRRMLARERKENEPKALDGFLEKENKQRQSIDTSNQQLNACMEIADFSIVHADEGENSKKAFYDKIDKVLAEIGRTL